MRTFEEWMDYQGIEIAYLTDDELDSWRSTFEEACERARQQKDWTPKARGNPDDRAYAVAVIDGSDLWLALWVRRSAKGDYFVLIPRSDHARDKGMRSWDPHVSYHRNGRFHQKSHNKPWMISQRQPPGPDFKGNENMLVTPLALESVRAVKARCDPDQYNGMLEVSVELFNEGKFCIAVDLTEAGGPALQHPGEIPCQKRFPDHVPEVVVTIYKYELTG